MTDEQVRFSDEYSMPTKRTRSPCVLDSAEWDRLGELIHAMKLPNPSWEGFGSALIGTAVSCGVSFFVSTTKSGSVPEWPWLWSGMFLMAIGLILYIVGMNRRNKAENSIASVIQFMEFLKKNVITGGGDST